MKLLATITPHNVDAGAPRFDYASFGNRTAARAIVFDGEKIALIHITKHDYYMLPGGGVEDEDLLSGLARELLEELGCEVEVTGEVGCIVVYLDRWRQKQTDYCYAARKLKAGKTTTPTDFEIEEGHRVVWASSLQEAIALVASATPQNRDGKLIRARDLCFLKQLVTGP